jgi:hypothetical protein
MLRIWSEFLPYRDASSPEVLDLLERFDVHPIFAVRTDSDLGALAELIGACRGRKLEPGVWPLLDRADGYWANETNARAWERETWHVLDALDGSGARPVWVAVDLEPPLDDVTAMLRDPLRLPSAIWTFARRNLDRPRFERAESTWNAVIQGLHEADYRTLGITVPLAAHDLTLGQPLWQDLLETPWSNVNFERHGVMAYNSMVAGYSRGLLRFADSRAAHDPLIGKLAAAKGPARSHVSIGLTGAGVLGDEPAYFEPAPLAADAAAVRAHGVEDIGLFCLEGLLDQRDPARWLEAVTSASARAPEPTRASRLIRTVGRQVPRALRAMRRLPARDAP